jgi:hypothetical protein
MDSQDTAFVLTSLGNPTIDLRNGASFEMAFTLCDCEGVVTTNGIPQSFIIDSVLFRGKNGLIATKAPPAIRIP